ncbi:MAG: (E)-4-hydroxy-3-methylbut-2-enyl-diphosphate synthase [Bacteroidales bacterium]|nr:(E)-4-hydroxy-3-methylbut-2-enyl-diphosphate synthase [Bacteroidales bacterium]
MQKTNYLCGNFWQKMGNISFTDSLFEYRRNKTIEVPVGEISIGGDAPIRIQSMTTTDTNDVESSVEQAIRIIEAGGEIVRLTTQGRVEAENIGKIREGVRKRGYTTPLVADVHFNPNAAIVAAANVEKVRINPGNYTGEQKKFDQDADKMTDEQWMSLIEEKLRPLIDVCKKNSTTLRIGVNHGSLSDRIMAKYGDTPQGMVASCIEYISALEKLDFRRIVISIKSSDTRVMVETVRLLSATMRQMGRSYPLHLGVTEAGSDTEGRIKSAAGIGALLVDGLGDTIRVSLTEAPEAEVPVAKKLVEYVASKKNHQTIEVCDASAYSPFEYRRRQSDAVDNVGGVNAPVIIANSKLADIQNVETDRYVRMSLSMLTEQKITELQLLKDRVIIAEAETTNPTAELRAFILKLSANTVKLPVVVSVRYADSDLDSFQLKASADTGLLFIDGLADGLMLINENLSADAIAETSLQILQATKVRYSKAEFISCPGCGRTLYNIQEATQRIKAVFGHLKGLKIAVMGCIVNGIGEMADADYGYVGAGPGKISLYRGKVLIKRALQEQDAINELVSLIKSDGRWIESKK